MGVLQTRIKGATPIEKWINLVTKWNSYHGCKFNDEAIKQGLFILKGEAKNLRKQYPELYLEACYAFELNETQRDCLEYGDYKFMHDFPSNLPMPLEVCGIKLFE